MNALDIQKLKLEYIELINQGDRTIKKLETLRSKQVLNVNIMDNISYSNVVAKKTSALLKGKSRVSTKNAKDTFLNYYNLVNSKIDISNYEAKSIFTINVKPRNRSVRNFINDINMRLDHINIESMIRTVVNIQRFLRLKLKCVLKEEKIEEIDGDFEKIIRKVKEIKIK